jgi:hypothetical protein
MERQLDFFRVEVPPCGCSSAAYCVLEPNPPWSAVANWCRRCGVTVGGMTLPSSW